MYEAAIPSDAVRRINPHKSGHEDIPSEYEAVAGLLTTLSPTAGRFTVPERGPAFYHRPAEGRAGRLALLALAAHHPLGPDGTPVDVAGVVDENGLAGVRNLVSDPSHDIVTRAFWPRDAPLLELAENPAVRASQLLTNDAAQTLCTGDTARFVTLRGALVADAVDDLLSNRMELGAPVRPPIADLVDPPESA